MTTWASASDGRCGDRLFEDGKAVDGTHEKERWRHSQQQTKRAGHHGS